MRQLAKRKGCKNRTAPILQCHRFVTSIEVLASKQQTAFRTRGNILEWIFVFWAWDEMETARRKLPKAFDAATRSAMKLRNTIDITPKALVGLIFAVTLGVSGCIIGGGPGPIARTAEMQTENVSVPLGAAKSVDVHLQMAAGELDISGGSPQLLDGTIKYNVPE